MFLGYIICDGKNYSLKNCRLETAFEPDGVTQKKIQFSIEDVGGFQMDVTDTMINAFHLTRREGEKHTIVNEALTEYHWKGRKSCGISEYLHKLS